MSFFLVLLGVASAMAHQPAPPAPQMAVQSTPPPPPGFPIDDHVIILFAIALIFGIYITMKLALKSANN